MVATRSPEGLRRSTDRLRQDLMSGLAAAVAEKGYAASTIADIVTHARVSKRTFYEHFADKEECLMALYAQGCEGLMEMLAATGNATAASGAPWQQVVLTTVNAYLSAMEAMPTVTRALLVEVQAAGPRAYRLRQRMQARFADTIVALVDDGRTMDPPSGLGPLSPELALALVGGINELLLQASDPYTGTATPFTALTDPLVRLVSAVLSFEPSSDSGSSPE
jgi:AcrR family transcriptional regulator